MLLVEFKITTYNIFSYVIFRAYIIFSAASECRGRIPQYFDLMVVNVTSDKCQFSM